MCKKNILSFLMALFLMNNSALALSNKEGYSKEYQNGFVYIGDMDYLDSIEKIGINDILVLDDRDSSDPNLKILSSYLVNDLLIQRDILKILLEYEENNPSLWDRSFESMQNEWIIHNLMVLLSYKKERTMDVDFNNGDEEKYSGEYLKRKILK